MVCGPLEKGINAWQDVTFIFQASDRAEQPAPTLWWCCWWFCRWKYCLVCWKWWQKQVVTRLCPNLSKYWYMYAFDKDCQNIIVLFQAWTREKQALGRQTPLRHQVCKSLYCIVHFWQWDVYIEDLNINEVRMRIIHCHSSLCDDGSK